MRIKEIPRDALELGFRSVRLPLSVAGKVLTRGGDTSTWGPVLLFDKAEAGVKDIVGRVTGDDTLRVAARLQRGEVAKREEALAQRARPTVVGERADRRADAKVGHDALESRRPAVEVAEVDVVEVEREREIEEAEREVEEAEREARERTARETVAKEEATRTTASTRKKAAAKRSAKAGAQRVGAEAEALGAAKAAVEAGGDEPVLDEAVQAEKSARRNQ